MRNEFRWVLLIIIFNHCSAYAQTTATPQTPYLVQATVFNDDLTSNNHSSVAYDWFVALPSPTHMAKNNSWTTPFLSAGAGGATPVRVRITLNGTSVIAPIWDVGPENTLDDYWDENRNKSDIDEFSLNNNFPLLGVPEYAWANNTSWHYKYCSASAKTGHFAVEIN